MRLSLVGFVLRRVCSSLRQLFWTHLLTTGIMAMTLFVFGGFMLLQTNLQELLKGWGDRLQISAYLHNNLAADEVARLIERVQSMPGVESVRHTSQEQAWHEFEMALGGQSGLLEGLPREVLPASLNISLAPAHRGGVAAQRLAERLKKESGVTSVEYPQQWIERLGLAVLAVESIKWTVAGVLFIAAFFIVGNSIKLAVLARQEEVEILQLVGASEGVIQAPFVIEGMVQGLAGGALAIAGLGLAHGLLQREITSVGSLLLPLETVRFLNFRGIGLVLGTGWLLGAIGSLVSLRRFLRTWHA